MLLSIHISIQLLIIFVVLGLLTFSLIKLNKYYTQAIMISTNVFFFIIQEEFMFTLIILQCLEVLVYFIVIRMIKYIKKRNEINEKFLRYVESKNETSYH